MLASCQLKILLFYFGTQLIGQYRRGRLMLIFTVGETRQNPLDLTSITKLFQVRRPQIPNQHTIAQSNARTRFPEIQTHFAKIKGRQNR